MLSMATFGSANADSCNLSICLKSIVYCERVCLFLSPALAFAYACPLPVFSSVHVVSITELNGGIFVVCSCFTFTFQRQLNICWVVPRDLVSLRCSRNRCSHRHVHDLLAPPTAEPHQHRTVSTRSYSFRRTQPSAHNS